MKPILKKIMTTLLEHQARRLLKKHKPIVVVVVGSIGKSSTKISIATVLGQKYRVRADNHSYNEPLAVPLAFFGLDLPENVVNPMAWLRILREANRQLYEPYDYGVVILELGTDHPGEIGYFSKYLKPDIAVVTAVAPEHMQGFDGSLEAVAKEELVITHYAKSILLNRDDVSAEYTKFVPDGVNLSTYGTSGMAEYRFVTETFVAGKGFTGSFISPELGTQKVTLKVVGEHNVRIAVGAGSVGVKLGLNAKQIADGLQAVRPFNGRMNLLRGMNKSQIIDDSYNSNPVAAVAALQTLYTFPTAQRIAVLGSMNELGDYSPKAHQDVGNACDPSLLDWVVTVGGEAAKYLAPAAAKKGCQVKSFSSPYDAGAFVHSILQSGAVVLVKGSQNGVFTEETAKMLLHATSEEAKLVRQSPKWMAIKEKQFSKVL